MPRTPLSYVSPWPDGPVTPHGNVAERHAAAALARFARAVRDARRAQRRTQGEVGVACGLRPQTIGAIETGSSWPDLRTIAAVAAELGVNLSATLADAAPGPSGASHPPAAAVVVMVEGDTGRELARVAGMAAVPRAGESVVVASETFTVSSLTWHLAAEAAPEVCVTVHRRR